MTIAGRVKQLLRIKRSDQIIDFVAYYLIRYLRQDGVLLDIGCGRGQYATVTNGKYIGLDLTAAPYSEGVVRRVNVIGNAEQLPFKNNTFDMVMAVACFYQIPNYSVALIEIHRVLKPGGRVLLFDYNQRTQQSLTMREGMQRPCWTQVELGNLLTDHGFTQATLHLPLRFFIPGWIARLFIPLQERYGLWAIATGVK